MPITIAIADDHVLFVKGLIMLINTLDGYSVVAEGRDGNELIRKIKELSEVPDIALIDVRMPAGKGGVETAGELKRLFPAMKLVALSGEDSDTAIISMFRAGCKSYLFKQIDLAILKQALAEIVKRGYYNSDASNIGQRSSLIGDALPKLTAKEMAFLLLACTELTYKQIASKMGVAERTVDGYREHLFEKFEVRSRVGLAVEAIRLGLVKI
jgi:DNA-binding NarL/FixJ family response regulator